MNATLQYHRRHSLNCTGKHPARSYTNEYDERKKGWARCRCPIYASGSLGRVPKRFPTKRTEWQEARDLMAPYLAANSWNILPPPDEKSASAFIPPGTRTDSDGLGRTHVLIADAIRSYLAEHDEAESARNTKKAYRLLTNHVQLFSDRIGMRFIDEWTPALVRQFRTGWGVAPGTAETRLSYLKAFFEHCIENEWVTRNPARLRRRRNHNQVTLRQQRIPFSDQELERMYEGCLVWTEKRGKAEILTTRYRRSWTGEDLRDFISISTYTGLRISDVARFHIDRLNDAGEVHVRTIKSGGGVKVCTCVPDWLAEQMRARAKRIGPLIFGEHRTDDTNAITELWRNRLDSLWEQIGGWQQRPVPHRFRHTFARILLQKGTPISIVAELLGNTEAVVRKYYKAWVPELQAHTSDILRRAFADVPRPGSPRRPKLQAIG